MEGPQIPAMADARRYRFARRHAGPFGVYRAGEVALPDPEMAAAILAQDPDAIKPDDGPEGPAAAPFSADADKGEIDRATFRATRSG